MYFLGTLNKVQKFELRIINSNSLSRYLLFSL